MKKDTNRHPTEYVTITNVWQSTNGAYRVGPHPCMGQPSRSAASPSPSPSPSPRPVPATTPPCRPSCLAGGHPRLVPPWKWSLPSRVRAGTGLGTAHQPTPNPWSGESQSGRRGRCCSPGWRPSASERSRVTTRGALVAVSYCWQWVNEPSELVTGWWLGNSRKWDCDCSVDSSWNPNKDNKQWPHVFLRPRLTSDRWSVTSEQWLAVTCWDTLRSGGSSEDLTLFYTTSWLATVRLTPSSGGSFKKSWHPPCYLRPAAQLPFPTWADFPVALTCGTADPRCSAAWPRHRTAAAEAPDQCGETVR